MTPRALLRRPPSLLAALSISAIASMLGAAACAPGPAPSAQPPASTPASSPAAPPAATAVAEADEADSDEVEPLAPGERECRRGVGVALALVIDRSGSMTGAPLDMTKRAAEDAAQRLRDDDYLDVIAFDSSAKRVVHHPVRQQRAFIAGAITAIQPGGGTQFFEALDMAYQDLSILLADRKYILFLSDGTAPAGGVEDLVKAAAAEGITVSTVGIGSSVDEQLLKTMADVGGGSYTAVSDPKDLPALFVKVVEGLEKEVDQSQ